MSLTAEDIQTQQFHVRFRGFDVDEVDNFLERAAEHFALIKDEKRQLEEQVEKLEMELKEFQSQGSTFQHAIISAQKITEEMQKKSRQEAKERREATLEEINRLRNEALEERESLQLEIAELKGSKDKVKEELRTYMQTYIDLLDQDIPLHENTPLALLQSDITEGAVDAKNKMEGATLEAFADGKNDLDDLYEKIDMPGDLNLDDKEEQAVHALLETELRDQEETEEEQLTIPDLEGDMLFSLEDPLEAEHEPDVAIEPLDDDNGKKET